MDIEALERDARERLSPGTNQYTVRSTGGKPVDHPGESSRAVAKKIAARERQVFAGENRHAAQLPADAQGAKGEAAELVGREKAR